MTTWAPVSEGPHSVPARRTKGLRRVAAIVVAALAAYLLLTPLLDALRPSAASVALDRYTAAPRPAVTRVNDAGFAAAFPEAPEGRAHSGAFDGAAVHGAAYEDDPASGYRFLVTYLDLPAAAAGRDRDVLAAALASTARSFDGTLASRTERVLDGSPATEFVVRDAGGAFRGRITLVGTRLYVYGVQSPAGHDALFTKFASSFSLLAD